MSSSMRTQSETSRVARWMSRAWLAGISTMFPSGEAWATAGEAPFRVCGGTASRACTVACQPASPMASDTIVVIFMLDGGLVRIGRSENGCDDRLSMTRRSPLILRNMRHQDIS